MTRKLNWGNGEKLKHLDGYKKHLDRYTQACTAKVDEIQVLRDALLSITNALELMAYNSAGHDHDLSTFCAIQSGIGKKALGERDV